MRTGSGRTQLVASKRKSELRSPSPTPRENASGNSVRWVTRTLQRRKESGKQRGKSDSRKRSPNASGSASGQWKQRVKASSGTAAVSISPARGVSAGAYRGGGTAGRSKGVSRVTVDISVARLQKWFRVLILRGVVKRRGLLSERISDSLNVQQCLWELSVRRAKRLLSEAFNAYAVRLHGGIETTNDESKDAAVSLVNAFMRAKKDGLCRTQQLHKIWQHAVRVIEKAWMNCALFYYTQQLGVECKRQRLVIQQEAIERRDYIRQRLLFLVECHQHCYNHPLLMQAGVAVRKLEWWEHVVMESSINCAVRHCPAAVLNSETAGDASTIKECGISTVMPPLVPRTSSLGTGSPCFVYPDASQRVIWVNAGKDEGSSVPTMPAPSVTHRFHVRADTAFVNGLLQEMGQLDFPTSMGLCPRASVPPQDSTGNVVSITYTARVQNTEHTSELVDSNLVWVGGFLLRECLQPLPLFKELSMWLRSREITERQNQQATTSSRVVVGGAANTLLLKPVLRKRARGRSMASVDFSVSVSTMGKAWADFYLFMELTGEACGSVSCSTSTLAFSLLPPSTLYRRNKGYLSSQSRGRVSLETLVGAGRGLATPVSRKLCTSTPTCAGEVSKTLSLTKGLGSEFDIKYEVERLFVREYHRRKKLQDEYNAEVVALGRIIHRDQVTTVNDGKTKMTDNRQPFQKDWCVSLLAGATEGTLTH
ncbi:hypothetical protein TraAM80_09227 [Trypanosoma rangeli]|uniref:Uncharacterized protein n=1 Tax=Trypanosoma rangeli TaxID=5698 RepID=A0A422MWN2_TRYRA|nr:uncharacterized protein TraAM80_09227 [Trypanosoma rangeli]RNE97638.1 hypothetical protein TraAM80_09227 [Trypanosoma rangeli]|eukprot:RNE97638.1 hypothetical protein TraAM80_09227 [Trypanosoma rangeli]